MKKFKISTTVFLKSGNVIYGDISEAEISEDDYKEMVEQFEQTLFSSTFYTFESNGNSVIVNPQSIEAIEVQKHF